MSKKLYVGNLSYQMSDNDLQDAFSAFGTVESARVITDRDTGRSKGFGFVEMSSPDEAQKCIENLDGNEVQGRGLRVSVAREKTDAPRGGGGGRSW